MKRIVYLAVFGAMALTSCSDYDLNIDVDEQIKENAESIFGLIDPKQDWSTINSESITITADAELDNIVKVQVLTAPPVFNKDAKVLNEAEANNGSVVTLVYDAPKTMTRLYAACVNSKGIYYFKGFDIGQSNVSFSKAARARTRAALGWDGLRQPEDFVIARSTPSFNKQRTDNDWGLWAGSGWNDVFYALSDGWEQNLIETVDNFTDEEKKDLEAIFDTYLQRDASKVTAAELINGRPDNLGKIKSSSIFSMDYNYITSDGSPLTVTPIGMASFETREGCWLYYFYFDPAIMNGLSSEEQVSVLKSLPKYKAIQCWRLGSKVGSGKTYGNDEIFREQVYYCPYYGDGEPIVNQTKAISFSIPAGYQIGFVQRMQKDASYTHTKMGELYGDGRLNVEINQLPSHFTGGKLEPTDPRQAIFSVNGTTYITFEDGSDRQFSDMILEIGSGVTTQNIEEPQEQEAAAYTLCFEDRPQEADYDLNDVVLRCTRKDVSTLVISLVAAGANDKVVLHGITGSAKLDNKEVHDIFNVSTADADGNWFVNTQIGGTQREVVTDEVKVEPTTTIPDFLKGIYIENKTTGRTIRYPETSGQPPYAIIVPSDFQYPLEQQDITKAYKTFVNWARNINVSGDWYEFENSSIVFPSLFK